ncbi:MAG: hypothetical protein ACJAVI_001150 [Candidatus Azotimanducaceae bacterium]|jgi:hypothetical protein
MEIFTQLFLGFVIKQYLSKIAVLLGICFSMHSVQALDELEKTDKIKAAYLFNFTKYIRWQESEFITAISPINLCSNASPRFNTFLAQMVKGRTASDNRTIRIVRLDAVSSKHCHLTYLKTNFISSRHPVITSLVVGDNASFLTQGANIHFFLEGRRIRFEINRSALQKHGLTISSELLKLARVVDSKAKAP